MTRARKRPGAARAIKAILGVQLAIGAILFGRDIAGTLPQLGFGTGAPEITRPVRPGDQTRLFHPSRLPAHPDPDTGLPPRGDMPNRLQFEPDAADPGVLHLTGTIAPGDAARFEGWLETGGHAFGTVELHSPGGSVGDALDIGRILRAAGATTRVAAGDICLSACPYLLAAGIERHVADSAYVGVHQHYFDENTVLPAFLAVADIQRGQGLVLDYLLEMGIDARLMTHALVTPPEEIYILLPEELEAYALITAAPS